MFVGVYVCVCGSVTKMDEIDAMHEDAMHEIACIDRYQTGFVGEGIVTISS